MKKHALTLLLAVIVSVLLTPPVKAQDCQGLAAAVFYASMGLSEASGGLARAHLDLAMAVAGGMTPSDPGYFALENAVVAWDEMVDSWQQAEDAASQAYHAACY